MGGPTLLPGPTLFLGRISGPSLIRGPHRILGPTTFLFIVIVAQSVGAFFYML